MMGRGGSRRDRCRPRSGTARSSLIYHQVGTWAAAMMEPTPDVDVWAGNAHDRDARTRAARQKRSTRRPRSTGNDGCELQVRKKKGRGQCAGPSLYVLPARVLDVTTGPSQALPAPHPSEQRPQQLPHPEPGHRIDHVRRDLGASGPSTKKRSRKRGCGHFEVRSRSPGRRTDQIEIQRAGGVRETAACGRRPPRLRSASSKSRAARWSRRRNAHSDRGLVLQSLAYRLGLDDVARGGLVEEARRGARRECQRPRRSPRLLPRAMATRQAATGVPHPAGRAGRRRRCRRLGAAAEQIVAAGERLVEEALVLERLAEDHVQHASGGARSAARRSAAATCRRTPAPPRDPRR